VDGDTITISTHRELTEAFEQFVTHPSYTDVTPIVLRVQVSFVKNQKGGNNKAMLNKIKAKRVMRGTGILAGDNLGLGNEFIGITATDAEKGNGATNGGADRGASNNALKRKIRREAKRNVEEKEEAERKMQKEEEEKMGATPSKANGRREKDKGDNGSEGTGEPVEEDIEVVCGI